MNINKDWDLNIFFKEDYDVYTDETTWDDVLTINPVVYSWGDFGVDTFELPTTVL